MARPRAILVSVSTQTLSVGAVDCSRYSSDRSNPECEEGGQIVIGIFAVAAVLVLAIGFIAWRLWLKKMSSGNRDVGDQNGPS